MADTIKPDICIIGAGALGLALAVKARRRGLGTVLVDRGQEEGGDSAGGALRRAAFFASAERAHAIATASKFGIDTKPAKPNFKAIGDHAVALAATVAPRDSAERLVALGVDMRRGHPVFSDRQTLKLDQTIIKARHFVLATGSSPAVPDITGLADVPYFTPDSVLDNTRKLSHLVVIGGDATAFELAQAYRRLGSDVTLVPQGPILPGHDRELVAILLRALREEGLDIVDGASVSAILPRRQGTGVTLAHADGSAGALDVSHILVALDRMPDLGGPMLEAARLKRMADKPDHLLLSADGLTSSPRISALGGAAGMDEIRALHLGERLLARLSGVAVPRLDPGHLPLVVATSPALAGVGTLETGDTPLRQGLSVLRANLGEHEHARAQGQAIGSAKLVVERSGRIAGGAMVGPGASEVIAMLAMAISQGLSAPDLAGLVLPPVSPASVLGDLGFQFVVGQAPSALARRAAALRRKLS